MIRTILASAAVATGLTFTPSTASAGPYGPGYGPGYGGGGYGSGYRGGYGGGYGGGHHHHHHHHHHGYPGPGYGYGGYRPGYPYVAPYRPYPVYGGYPIPVGPVVQPGFSFGLSIVR